MALTPLVTIDEKTHTYRRVADGVVVPSCTQVLRHAGFGVNKFYTDEGREVGKAAHLACRFYDEGRLDWASLDPARESDSRIVKMKQKIRARVESYIKFRKDTGFVPDLIEFLAYSPQLDVAGTIDRTGHFPDDPYTWLIDLKGGAEADWHGYQTAGYTIMEFPNNDLVKRAALYLKDTGKRAQLRLHTNTEDFPRFAAAAVHFPRENLCQPTPK